MLKEELGVIERLSEELRLAVCVELVLGVFVIVSEELGLREELVVLVEEALGETLKDVL